MRLILWVLAAVVGLAVGLIATWLAAVATFIGLFEIGRRIQARNARKAIR